MLHLISEITGLNGEIAKIDALLETLCDNRDALINELTCPTKPVEESDFDAKIRDLYSQMTHPGLVNEVMKKDRKIEALEKQIRALQRNGSQ